MRRLWPELPAVMPTKRSSAARFFKAWLAIPIDWKRLFTRLQRYQDRAAFGSRQRLRGPCRGKEVRPMEHDKERSWLRLLITIAIDWRFVIAVILLLLLLLRK